LALLESANAFWADLSAWASPSSARTLRAREAFTRTTAAGAHSRLWSGLVTLLGLWPPNPRGGMGAAREARRGPSIARRPGKRPRGTRARKGVDLIDPGRRTLRRLWAPDGPPKRGSHPIVAKSRPWREGFQASEGVAAKRRLVAWRRLAFDGNDKGGRPRRGRARSPSLERPSESGGEEALEAGKGLGGEESSSRRRQGAYRSREADSKALLWPFSQLLGSSGSVWARAEKVSRPKIRARGLRSPQLSEG
jgi:hypothetical protein